MSYTCTSSKDVAKYQSTAKWIFRGNNQCFSFINDSINILEDQQLCCFGTSVKCHIDDGPLRHNTYLIPFHALLVQGNIDFVVRCWAALNVDGGRGTLDKIVIAKAQNCCLYRESLDRLFKITCCFQDFLVLPS